MSSAKKSPSVRPGKGRKGAGVLPQPARRSGGRIAPGRVVPPAGQTAQLTLFTAAAMAFLAVFALALAFAADRLAGRWETALADTATLRIVAEPKAMADAVAAAGRVLDATPGILAARALGADETRAILAPFLGADLPLDTLPLPVLIAVTADPAAVDVAFLRQRLAAEVPGASYDDHAAWRAPLADAAGRMRAFGILALGLIGAVTGAMVMLAAQASLAANGQVIRVLRLLGARDGYIAGAFMRRFTLRAILGAGAGTATGAAALAAFPAPGEAEAFLTGLGLAGAEWLWLFLIPPAAGTAALAATGAAAFSRLRGLR